MPVSELNRESIRGVVRRSAACDRPSTYLPRSARLSSQWWMEGADITRREGAAWGVDVEDIADEYTAQAVAAALEGR